MAQDGGRSHHPVDFMVIRKRNRGADTHGRPAAQVLPRTHYLGSPICRWPEKLARSRNARADQ